MAKRGGFPGGMAMPGNMSNLMKQAQRMQRQMEEQQQKLAEMEFTGSAGGGAVTATVSGGTRMVTKVSISSDACDPDDVETLEEMVMAAVNDAYNKLDEENNSMMGKFSGGLGGAMGGAMGGLGI